MAGQKITQDINIGSKLRSYRKKHGYTQSFVAEELRKQGIPISREIYAQIESGIHHLPISILIALHDLYGFSYDELFS